MLQATAVYPATASSSHDIAPTISSLDQIAYCCIATPGVVSLAWADRLAQANSSLRTPIISGLLMWEGRLMLHWLEGPSAQLQPLWAEIQNDPRQYCLVLLTERRGVAKRLFADWQMQSASRNEIMAIVRKAKEQASQAQPLHDPSLQHAISTLSILLDPDLTECYAQVNKPRSNSALAAQGVSPEPQALSA
jgi:hypothetical protein